jgi:hypothetical protein
MKISPQTPCYLLILAGILLFCASFIFGLTDINAVQFTAFALILSGVVWLVWKAKKGSRY